ncbi:MAG TPA: YqgE/AlgH family protein [Nitrospiria bacterium]|nr:YqgE/AlgH family protein [Nitrospiria bacterium]
MNRRKSLKNIDRTKDSRFRLAGLSFGLLAVALWLILAPSPGAISKTQAVGRLHEGVFLVATSQLGDPNFSETVVLLVHYDKRGATGLVVNRKTDVPVDRAIPEAKGLEGLSRFLFVGGPVQRDLLLALIETDKGLPDAQKILDRTYMTLDKETLLGSIKGGNGTQAVRIYSGYSGWGPGQLDGEVIRGDWTVIDADPDSVFSNDPSGIWEKLSKMGEKIQI